MSKLCNCKKQLVRDLFVSTTKDAYEAAENMYTYPLDAVKYSTSKTEEVSKIIESDCVCEKKEFRQPCFYCPFVAVAESSGYCSTLMVAHNKICSSKETCKCRYHSKDCNGEVTSNGVCKDCPPNCIKEKQSQSPCDHDNPGKVWSYWTEGSLTLYGCQKCGLVTCLNPNDK